MGTDRQSLIRDLFLLGVLVYLLQLLLRLQPLFTLGTALLCLAYYPLYLRQKNGKEDSVRRFEEACLYLDTLLYAFDREGKILQAYEAAAQSFPPGRLRQSTMLAISRMQMISDENQVVEEALHMMEELYPCRRIRLLHQFMLEVEACGGSIHSSIALMQADKCRWEKRIRSQMRERKELEGQIILSVAASMMICSVVLFMPSLRMDISRNPLVQSLSLLVLFLNEVILYKSSSYRTCDWLRLDELEIGRVSYKDARARMTSYRSYDRQKEARFSVRLLLLPAAFLGPAFYYGRAWLAAFLLLLMALFMNQHQIGHSLMARRLKRELQSTFPEWMMDMVLLLQTDNVMVALEKSLQKAPLILQMDLQELLGRLQMEPESALAYHSFLQEFEIPQVHSAMSMLYSLSMGHMSGEEDRMSALIDMNLEMQDGAERQRMKDRTSGMYLLFLAPILTASLKLVVDMAVFLMGFLGSEVLMR